MEFKSPELVPIPIEKTTCAVSVVPLNQAETVPSTVSLTPVPTLIKSAEPSSFSALPYFPFTQEFSVIEFSEPVSPLPEISAVELVPVPSSKE